jgi:hypothetical protein
MILQHTGKKEKERNRKKEREREKQKERKKAAYLSKIYYNISSPCIKWQ